jgi:hypothetical protein
VQTNKNRAIFQLESSDSPTGPFVPHGGPVDTYTPGIVNNVELPVASATSIETGGTRYFRIRVVGRNPAATARYLALDNLRLARPAATIVLGNLSQVYDGTAKMPTFTTTPAGLAVLATYNGEVDAVNVGTYAITATITDPNFVGDARGTLTIAPAAATVALSDLAQIYDGTPRVVGPPFPRVLSRALPMPETGRRLPPRAVMRWSPPSRIPTTWVTELLTL